MVLRIQTHTSQDEKLSPRVDVIRAPWALDTFAPGNGRVLALSLTTREREVLALVAEGCSNKIVAAHLSIAERTVKSHLTKIMTKLQAADRTHAVVTAVRLGWLAI